MSRGDTVGREREGIVPTIGGVKSWAEDNTKALVLGYPLSMLLVFFGIPSLYLLVVSFFPQSKGEFYHVGFTLEHYIRFFESPVYMGYLIQTIEFAALTAILTTVTGYPIAYWLARVDSRFVRELYLLTIVASMWLTVIIRAYAVRLIFSGNGIFNKIVMGLGLASEPLTSGSGYLTVMLGMFYGFLPFAVLTMYTSVKNIDAELEEASRNLGASKLQTIKEITLPLSRNGIAAAATLVFILSIGSYTVPRLLGTPQEWTIPIAITDSVQRQMNIPFGSAMAVMLTLLVVALFIVAVRYLGLGSDQLIGDEYEGEADG